MFDVLAPSSHHFCAPLSSYTLHINTMRISAIGLCAVLPSVAFAWVLSTPRTPLSQLGAPRGTSSALRMALDYNDPIVAEEFNAVQPLSYEEVEEELLESGIRAPATMNEMEVRLMLVEMRLRKSGRMPGKEKEKKKPTKFSSKFEEALYTKPAFEEYYNSLKAKGDHNAMNAVAEFVNEPELAQKRYKEYKAILRNAKIALTAPPPVKTPTIKFSGFPANMGEPACKMTLEAVGAISDFECSESDEFPILTGKVTFEDIEAAKKAVEQYNGMDMGMGTMLELTSV